MRKNGKKENGNQGIITNLGFRDISIPLGKRVLEEIRKYDVIRGVWVKSEKEELHNGKKEKIYSFESAEYNIHGRIFPLDEIIYPESKCDIIDLPYNKVTYFSIKKDFIKG